jgi:hypothetical protein
MAYDTNTCFDLERSSEPALNILIRAYDGESNEPIELLAGVADPPNRIGFVVGDEQ